MLVVIIEGKALPIELQLEIRYAICGEHREWFGCPIAGNTDNSIVECRTWE